MLEFFLLAALGCAIVAYLLLLLHDRPIPFWAAPVGTLIVALLLVVGAGVAMPLPLGGVLLQAATVLILAWAGWALLGLRRG